MITRPDIIWLGVAAGVGGGLVGGLMLGIGMSMILSGLHLGWLVMLPGAPALATDGLSRNRPYLKLHKPHPAMPRC